MAKILVADDDPDILRLVKITLDQQGLQVITARDGEEAVQAAIAVNPDLVLLDGMMPRLDGYAAARRIQAELSPAPIVIMLTANKLQGNSRQSEHDGVDDYIVKPFAPRDLGDRIRRLLAGRLGDPNGTRSNPVGEQR
jgi:DNA-binding response OmpR family regulator